MKKVLGYSIFLVSLCLFLLAFSACGTQVRFHLNFVVDGEIYDTIDTAGQEAVSMPRNPTKEGYDFDGWFWDEGTWARPFTANSLLDAPLSSDLSVYAKWKSDDIPKVDPSAAEIVSAPAFEINGNALSLTLPNATESYSFLGQITVSAGATWQISSDMQGLNSIPTKTVPLNVGDNTFYLLVTSANREGISLYTVSIRRRPIYTVSFNANGGNSVTAMRAEEDSTITPPSTTRTGYSFAGWDYDFAQPIKGNMTTAAKWTSNADTSYTVEYYLQKADATGYDLEERVPLMGTTASTVTAEQKTYPHFTYKASGSTKTGTIAPDGSLVLKLYYTRDTYTVTFVGNGGTLETGNATQTVRYGNAAIIPTFARKGYTFTGWDNTEGCDAVTEDLTVTAQWEINTYTVSYDVNGGETVANPVTYQITDDVTLDEPQREYYCFLGWYTASNEKVDNLQGNAEDLTLTAKWECFFTMSGNSITGVSSSCRQKVNEIVIPDSLNGTAITGIATSAFTNYTNLTSISIPGSVTSIGKQAFSGCTGLTSVAIPDSIISIGDYAFSSCSGLASVTIPDSVTSIGERAFANCKGLTSVKIGNGVTSIGAGAFRDCTRLTAVTIPEGVTIIKEDTFYGCSQLKTVTIPDSLTSIGTNAFRECSGLTSVTIPNSVTYIGLRAFYLCVVLDTVTIGNKVTSIGDYAFFSCAITTITIPNSVTSIREGAFCYCSALTSVTIGNKVTSIEGGVFSGCSKLTSIIIPDCVTTIGENAFFNCTKLTAVTIPDGVTNIGEGAFWGCTVLTSVNYQGTEAQWSAILKAKDWNSGTGDYTIHCTDGDISK